MSDAAGVPGEGKRQATSTEAMAVIDGSQYALVNESYAELFGVDDTADLEGAVWADTLAAGEPERFEQEILPACRAEGRWRGEVSAQGDAESVLLDLSVRRFGTDRFICTARAAGAGGSTVLPLPIRDRFIKRVLDEVDDILYVLDGDGDTLLWNEQLLDTTGYTDAEIDAIDLEELIAPEQHEHVPGYEAAVGQLGDQYVDLDLVTKDGERIPHAFRGTTFEDPVTGEFYRCGVARDIRERIEREQTLERQRDELETLTRINNLIFEVTRDLFTSPTRDEIEQTVCDRLAASDLYQFAWIGTQDPGDAQVVPRVSAGVDDGYVDEVTVTSTGSDTGQGPGGRAMRTGEIQVTQDVRTDPTFEPWRDAALERGIQSAAAIPLVHDETVYGILAVYATRPLAFSHRAQAGFETLGEAVGFAINAIDTRKLLFADTVVELEFEITDPGLALVGASERLDCELSITGFVETESGDWSVYLAVDGAAPLAVQADLADAPDVDEVRVIAADDDAGLLDVVMVGPAIDELTEHGAILTSGDVEDGTGRFCIEAPQSADIRSLSERLRTVYPESTLVAQRELDRPAKTAEEIRQSLEDQLTDRQREAIDRAYHSGYFDWPRTSTAGEVAASMDVAETTFHYHLRNALDALLAALTDLERS